MKRPTIKPTYKPMPVPQLLRCPTCERLTPTAWEQRKGYHCQSCTELADRRRSYGELRELNNYLRTL